MIDQADIGRFIADLRKEKKWTQEQFAEMLGVNHRSISRWENGHSIPDLSLWESIAEALDISIPELLFGRHIEKGEGKEIKESMGILIDILEGERKQKSDAVRKYFLFGLICFLAVIIQERFSILSLWMQKPLVDFLEMAVAGLGFFLEGKGFYINQQDWNFTPKDIEQIAKKRWGVSMKTMQEMIQFVEKRQKLNMRLYKKSFAEIESNLKEDESVWIVAAGNSFSVKTMPMMWHVVLAFTNDRIIISGERQKGIVFTKYTSFSYPLAEVTAVETGVMLHTSLVIKIKQKELTIEIGDAEVAEQMKKEIEAIQL